MIQNHAAPGFIGTALLVAMAFSVAALAGCISSQGVFDDEKPSALLTVDGPERWVGEKFTFDASTSVDPNGEITQWHFDFGDGAKFQTDNEDKAKNVTHTYKAGGTFDTTLTITDDGANQTGMMTTTDVVVVTVHEEHRVPVQVNYAAPQDVGGFAKSTVRFQVNQDAVSYESNITVVSTIPAGTSTVMLRVLAPQGAQLEEKEVTVEAGKHVTQILAGEFDGHGTFTLEIVVTSGGVSTDGMMYVFYSEDPVEPEN